MIEYKAVTIRQPWAGWMFGVTDHAPYPPGASGPKDVENRTWKTSHRGPLLIHAGVAFALDMLRSDGADGLKPEMSPLASLVVGAGRDSSSILPGTARGAIIGIVDLYRVCQAEQQSNHRSCSCGFWKVPYRAHWKLERPQLLTEPIPYSGKQGVFKITDVEVLARLQLQLGDRLPV